MNRLFPVEFFASIGCEICFYQKGSHNWFGSIFLLHLLRLSQIGDCISRLQWRFDIATPLVTGYRDTVKWFLAASSHPDRQDQKFFCSEKSSRLADFGFSLENKRNCGF
ncbi:hypothetical protein TNCT_636791 [Trichonephila clavata]|uniref:Uncharacterized protein n=1 Tax=Trichonephila clavata TaxID=2740835 RepID=A0A8X6LT30_TRICU|nr:hypothetical protein TNCT_636791 [Trichonephila clavata]